MGNHTTEVCLKMIFLSKIRPHCYKHMHASARVRVCMHGQCNLPWKQKYYKISKVLSQIYGISLQAFFFISHTCF